MSNILIRGIEMPKSCRDCPMKMNCDDCEGLECVCVPLHIQIGYVGALFTDKRRDDCPLIPIPEHGDLIDRDKAISKFTTVAETIEEKQGYIASAPYVASALFLKNAEEFPTVIPANPAEEGE